jgi:hypothetical protein
VAKKGTICPIFEGDMPLKKMTPKVGRNITAITGKLLREDPLSAGILDMFFLKISNHSSLKLREFIYLKIGRIFNSFNSNDPN